MMLEVEAKQALKQLSLFPPNVMQQLGPLLSYQNHLPCPNN
jgi:hypothetical protein